MKPYEEIQKIITGQGENYTTVSLLDHDYIKNHYKLIAILNRQKNFDADPIVIQHRKFVGRLRNTNCKTADGTESMFLLIFFIKKSKK